MRVLMEVAGRANTERPVTGRSPSPSSPPRPGSGDIISPSRGDVGSSSMGACDGVVTKDLLEEERLETSSEE